MWAVALAYTDTNHVDNAQKKYRKEANNIL